MFRVNDMEVFFRDIELLTRFYGCRIFERRQVSASERHLFYVKAAERHADGVGYYDETNRKFVLMPPTFRSHRPMPTDTL